MSLESIAKDFVREYEKNIPKARTIHPLVKKYSILFHVDLNDLLNEITKILDKRKIQYKI